MYLNLIFNIHSKTPIPWVTTLDCDYMVTESDSVSSPLLNCQQYGDYTAFGSSVTFLPAVGNSYYTATVPVTV